MYRTTPQGNYKVLHPMPRLNKFINDEGSRQSPGGNIFKPFEGVWEA